MTDIELKTCPWCDAKVRIMHDGMFWVQCTGCGAQTGKRRYLNNAMHDWCVITGDIIPREGTRSGTSLSIEEMERMAKVKRHMQSYLQSRGMTPKARGSDA